MIRWIWPWLIGIGVWTVAEARPPGDGGTESGAALLQAAAVGDVVAARRLLEGGADPQVRTPAGLTPLHLAAAGGHREMCEMLAVSPARKAAGPVGAPALGGGDLFSSNYKPGQPAAVDPAREAYLRQLDFTAFLESLTGNLSARDGRGRTPLHCAALCRKAEVVDALLGLGADVNAADEGGYTALHLAALAGDGALCERLVARGARASLRTVAGAQAAELAKDVAMAVKLRGAVEKGKNDPAAQEIRRQAQVLLIAMNQGDGRSAREVIAPEKWSLYPERIEPLVFEGRELGCEIVGGRGYLEYCLTTPELKIRPNQQRFSLVFEKRERGWLVTSIDVEPFNEKEVGR